MSAIGNEYGNALFLLAKETGILDETADAIEGLGRIFDENRSYIDFLSTPSIPIEERIGAVGGALHGRVPDCVSDFICLLVERNYIRSFGECAEAFEKEYNRLLNIAVADVVSARALTEEEKKLLRARLEKSIDRRVKLRLTVDETIVGGMKVRIDGKLYDGSLKSRIIEIGEEMKK